VPVQPGRHQLHRARLALAEPYVESFGGRLRDELLAVEAFSSLLKAQVLVENWRMEYYTLRPHSALGYLTPTDYAKAWTTHHPALGGVQDPVEK
jgi:transposase InsO family protein